jgi:biotin operon repressor
MARKKAARAVSIKQSPKTTPEAFIKAVMGASSMADAAKVLGCTRQAISKRLREYKAKGVKGLPEYDGREVTVVGVQELVDKYRKGKA